MMRIIADVEYDHCTSQATCWLLVEVCLFLVNSPSNESGSRGRVRGRKHQVGAEQ
jgi:hypothetical protein